MTIKFYFEQPVRLKQRLKLKEFIKHLVLKEKGTISSLSFIFCSDEYLLQINQQFLQHDYLTDIVTFDLKEKTAKDSIGEVYISADRVAENAEKFASSIEEELRRVIFHGVLHLCGYKDKTAIQKKQMRSKEDYYISLYERST